MLSFFRIFVTLFHFNRTNWKAVALCFLAATVFWLFNALNKTYSTHIRFPLQFQYDENHFANAAELPKDLPINVSGNGWDLFRKTFGVKLPVLTLTLDRPAEIKKLVATTLPPLLAGQLGNLTINFVAIDTLRLQIDERIVRKFRLVVNDSAISYRDNRGRTSAVDVNPDSVELNGPASILSPWPDSLVLPLPAKRIGASYREEVEVLLPHSEFIKRNPPVVEVNFEVSEMVSLEKKIKVVTPPLSWGMVLETDSVVCRLMVPVNLVQQVNQSKLAAVLGNALVPMKKGERKFYLPTVSGLPPYTSVVHADSILLEQH